MGKIIRALGGPLLILIAALSVYVRTMPPAIAAVGYSADSIKFQYIGKIFGTPHFGYPTYMFLNILVSRLPWFNLAYRLNLLSAALASATLVTLYFIILSVTGKRFVAVACSLIFGFTYTFWENSIITEVYSLNTLFMCAVILLMLKWKKSGKPVFFYLGCLAYALSFGNHLIGITMLPALVYWTFAAGHKILLKKRTWLLVTAFILLGMSQYGYILLRSYQNPPGEKVFQYWPYSEDFGKTHIETRADSIPELFDKVSGDRWKDRLVEHPPATKVSAERLSFFRALFLLQFGPAGLALGLTGIGLSFMRERKRALFFLLLLLSHLAFLISWAMAGVYGIDVHAIPGYLFLTIFIAHNSNLFDAQWFSRHRIVRRAGRVFLVIVLFATAVSLAVWRYRRMDQSKNIWLAEMLDTVAPQIPDDSIIFTNHVYATAFWYKLYGEGARPGARITAYPIWTVYYEDLDYALKHYRNVFYFLDQPYWPTIADMGIDFDVITFSQGDLQQFLSSRKPGEIVAAYAVIEETPAARADLVPPSSKRALLSPFLKEGKGGFSMVGVVEAGGNIRVLSEGRGLLSFKKGSEIGGVKIPADIVIAPGEAVYIDGVSCSRYRKDNNLALVDSRTGQTDAMVFVDWDRGESVEPANFLRVKSYSKPN